MEIKGERLIPASMQATWHALNDPAILKDCIAGCESLTQSASDQLTAVMQVRVGPVSARFKGSLKLSNLNPPHGYRLSFEGQGGVAGFGRGTADVVLAEQGQMTRMNYTANAQIGGRLAQVGSRLIDAAATKIAEDFFSAFIQRVQADRPTVDVASGNGDGAKAQEPWEAAMAGRWIVLASVIAFCILAAVMIALQS